MASFRSRGLLERAAHVGSAVGQGGLLYIDRASPLGLCRRHAPARLLHKATPSGKMTLENIPNAVTAHAKRGIIPVELLTGLHHDT